MRNYEPIGGTIVVVDMKAKERTAGGIYIPDSAQKQEEVICGMVYATSMEQKNGELIEPEVVVGDKVLYSNFSGAGKAVEDDGFMVRFVKPSELIAVLED